MEKLVKVIYNWVDQNNYEYFLTEPDGTIDAPNCTSIVEINREWIKAIDGDESWEVTNLNKKYFKK
jgi:hypothetical protein